MFSLHNRHSKIFFLLGFSTLFFITQHSTYGMPMVEEIVKGATSEEAIVFNECDNEANRDKLPIILTTTSSSSYASTQNMTPSLTTTDYNTSIVAASDSRAEPLESAKISDDPEKGKRVIHLAELKTTTYPPMPSIKAVHRAQAFVAAHSTFDGKENSDDDFQKREEHFAQALLKAQQALPEHANTLKLWSEKNSQERGNDLKKAINDMINMQGEEKQKNRRSMQEIVQCQFLLHGLQVQLELERARKKYQQSFREGIYGAQQRPDFKLVEFYITHSGVSQKNVLKIKEFINLLNSFIEDSMLNNETLGQALIDNQPEEVIVSYYRANQHALEVFKAYDQSAKSIASGNIVEAALSLKNSLVLRLAFYEFYEKGRLSSYLYKQNEASESGNNVLAEKFKEASASVKRAIKPIEDARRFVDNYLSRGSFSQKNDAKLFQLTSDYIELAKWASLTATFIINGQDNDVNSAYDAYLSLKHVVQEIPEKEIANYRAEAEEHKKNFLAKNNLRTSN